MERRSSSIDVVRQAAWAVLTQKGRFHDADIVARGKGDDFLEVRTALLAVERANRRIALLERALRCYADPDFWEGEPCEATLAYHDRGETARAALEGREGFARHRD